MLPQHIVKELFGTLHLTIGTVILSAAFLVVPVSSVKQHVRAAARRAAQGQAQWVLAVRRGQWAGDARSADS